LAINLGRGVWFGFNPSLGWDDFMATAELASSSTHLSHILNQLCVNIQLSPDQLTRATESYGAVTTWLAAPESAVSCHAPLLYPQGSLALDTTVRPIYQNEFDLDVVCRLDMGQDCTPEEVYELVWDRLAQSGVYEPILERMPRCIRLNYAESSQFHLDVVPAIADRVKRGTHIRIADGPEDDMEWKTSNPKGFFAWFESRKVVLMERHAKAEIEPLHPPLPAEQKAVLTKVVQVLKRWRDVKWKKEPKLATPSIILTYLAADHYAGQESLADAVMAILVGIEDFIESGQRSIIHPANKTEPAEVISEKWLNEPETYDAFAMAIGDLRRDWSELLYSKRGNSLYETLNTMFGEPMKRAIKEASEPIARARANGSLLLDKSTGHLLTTVPAAFPATKVRPNTFYGD
jgi:hypothetical protein